MKRKCTIATLLMLALLPACKNPASKTPEPPASYTVKINMSGNIQGDGVTASPASGKAGKEITLSYSVANTAVNNRLVFSGTTAAIVAVDSAGTGTRKYTIDKKDANAEKIITINAVFTHLDTQPAVSYTIAVNMSGNVQGDSVTASPASGKAGNEITLNYTVAAAKIYNRLVFSGVQTAIAQADSAGSGTRSYTINEEDAAEGVITINAVFAHSDKQLDTIAFADANNVTKTYGDASFTKAITTTGSGTGAISYASSDTTVAAVDSATGAVTILKVGTATITATKAADATYEQATAMYNLTVTQLQLTIANPSVTTTKAYDGNTNAEVTAGTLTNKAGNDAVTVSAVASFNSANAAEANLITVVYAISGADAANYNKPVDYTVAGSITKAPGSAVSVPSAASVTKNSITINAVTLTQPAFGQTAEYAISTTVSPVPTSGWQAGLSFSSLNPDTYYYVFARSKESANYNAGAAQASAVIRTQAGGESQPAVSTIVDFEADATGKTYGSTKAGSAPTVKVIADPLNSGQKSLQITSTTYNQAAVVPVNLPYELHNYKSFSFRFNLLSSADLNGQSIMVYVAKDTATFKDYGFGNPADSTYPQFAANLLGSTTAENLGGSHRNKWTDYTITITNPGDAIKGLKGDIFVAIGINCQNGADYLIDDLIFTPKDDFVPPYVPPPPLPPIPPSTGAVVSGNYRNMFEEWGKTSAEVTAKVDAAWNKLFNGTETEKIYYTAGSDKAYILDTGNNDVRSEGMSYGMMMCVQLNKQSEFDRLWTWAKTYMYNETAPSSGKNNRGYFSWQCGTDGSVKDGSPAPDGEIYFVTALLFASARWGDGSGVLEYGKWARKILYDLIRRTVPPDPYSEPSIFNTTTSQNPGYGMVRFGTLGASASFTDPSYHLPAFYEVWAHELENGQYYPGIWASKAEMNADAAFWSNAAQVSRNYFPTTTNSTTGLGPDYSEFNGTAKNEGDHKYFEYDAWRIAMNIAMDYAWWAKDSWQKTFADRIQGFFVGKGVTTYGNRWTLDGTQRGSDHSPGLVACNAVASLAATNENAWKFIEDFWNINMTMGQYRYYDGCLYMLGMLHVSGNFKAYLSSNTTVTPSSGISPTTATFDKKTEEQADIAVTMTLNGNTLSNIKNGAANLTSGTDYTVSGSTVTLKKAYLAAQANGTTTLTFTFSAGKTSSIVITIKDTTGGGGGGDATTGYDFSTISSLPAGYPKYDGTIVATITGGVLSVNKTSNNTTAKFTLPFNVGSQTLANYSGIKINVKGVTGDFTYKVLSAAVGSTNLGSVNNAAISNVSFGNVTIPISGGSSFTGDVEITFSLGQTTPYVIEIASIELIPK